MTLSKIEKCARLMQLSYKVSGDRVWLQYDTSKREYNPLTNKADLVDLMCAAGIDANWDEVGVLCGEHENGHWDWGYFKDHPDKQTALAHAVVDVACQIYDRQFGGE